MLINEVTKIKLFKQPAIKNSRKIKITQFDDDYHFSVEAKARENNLPLQYFWFAKLITMKLA